MIKNVSNEPILFIRYGENNVKKRDDGTRGDCARAQFVTRVIHKIF